MRLPRLKLPALLVLSLFFTATGSSFAQQTLVQLSNTIHSDIFEKSLNPLPLFKLQNSEVEMNSTEGKKAPVKFKVVLPSLSKGSDTSYCFLYFGANKQKEHGGYVAVLVINACNRKDPLFYIDHNLNFNFTDDGEPIVFKRTDPELIIQLKNPDDPNAVLSYRISRFNFIGKDNYRDMMDNFYHMQEKSRVFIGVRCSFREQRFNCRGGSFTSASDSISVGLMDVNCNGIFTDPGIDKVLVSEYNAPYLPTEIGFGATLIPAKKDEVIIEFRNNQFKVSNIHPYGNSITVEQIPEEKISLVLAEGSKIPDVTFVKASGKKLKLKKWRRSYVYLYFVRFPYDSFMVDTTSFVALQKKYPGLKLVWIHYGGNPKTLQILSGLPNVTWNMAYSNRKINKALGIGHFPMGILIEKKRKVKKFNISPQEVEKFLPSG